MNQHTHYTFQGNPALRPSDAHEDSPEKPEPYIAAPELKQAVNLALFLRRPLLIEGEAGCGKTRLARAVAFELGLPFYVWHVRSTSKASEGLYNYDAILRLHDVQTQSKEKEVLRETGNTNELAAEKKRNPSDPRDYRQWGAIGRAFRVEDRPAVVLIDEIDKADLDFPNDLLAVLDDPWEFEIPQTGETITAKHQPVVIVTSNKEKGNLPAPFLRRCIYHYVSFPSQEQLKQIVEIHYQTRQQALPDPDPTDSAITRLLEIRKAGGLHKMPGTSEFLDWLEALCRFDSSLGKAIEMASKVPIPYPELLFKLKADWQRYATAS